ncbi:MAG: hypothetical protein J5379_04265 [Clostridiales bacterium]|nr:hypothetical protein [Clostridiales bacterium]
MLLRNLVLVLIMLSLLPLGLFFMKRLDRFLSAENETREKKNSSSVKPKRIYLSGNATDEEILKEIRACRKEYKHLSIIISDEEEKKIS